MNENGKYILPIPNIQRAASSSFGPETPHFKFNEYSKAIIEKLIV